MVQDTSNRISENIQVITRKTHVNEQRKRSIRISFRPIETILFIPMRGKFYSAWC